VLGKTLGVPLFQERAMQVAMSPGRGGREEGASSVDRFFRPVAKARHFQTIEKNTRVEVSLLPQHWNPERAKL
jgi:hypothetical protein